MKNILSFFMKIYAKFVPVNNKLIVMESNPVLQDNTGALFEKMIELELVEKFQFIWFVFEDEKIPELDLKNVKFVRFRTRTILQKIHHILISNHYYARAKYNFFSHRMNHLFPLKSSQVNFNLTHGVPIKDSTGLHMQQTYVTDILATSQLAGELRVSTYSDTEHDKLRVLGFPRNDRLISSKYVSDKKYIVWLPTYRKHNSKLKEGEFDFFPLSPKSEDFKELNDSLANLDIVVYIKPHPAQKLDMDTLNYEYIKLIDDSFVKEKGIHLYDLLSKSEALITDYSSVYVDYLLVNKPIIFTFDDFDKYTESWGFTVDDIEKYTPGKKVYDMFELIKAIEKTSKEEDEFFAERQKITNEFHKYKDSKASERILEYVGIL